MTESSDLLLEFDSNIFGLTAIKKAAYKFGDRCHIQIDTVDNKISVTLRAKRKMENIHFLEGEFRNEVLDQDLREIIAAETEGIRNLLLAQAFSSTSLLDPQGETEDYSTDPLNIRPSDKQKETGPQQPFKSDRSGTCE